MEMLIVFAAAVAAFALVLGLLWNAGKRIDEKAARLKSIKRDSDAQEEPKKILDIAAIKANREKKKKARMRGQSIAANKKGAQNETERRLMMAEIPLSGTQYLLIRVGIGAVLALIALLATKKFGLESNIQLLAAAFGLILGMMIPNKLVDSKVKKKQALYRDALPDIMDLLVVSVEAGLGFDSAIIRLYSKDKSPLMQEMMRAIQDVQHGMSRREAYANLASRCSVKEITAFTNAIVQAEMMGISIKSVLIQQAAELRESRRQRAEEKALKAPVKMLVPMVIFIFPVIFIILLGPGIMNIAEAFK